MSYSLVGYLVCGPKTLDPEKVRALKSKIQRHIELDGEHEDGPSTEVLDELMGHGFSARLQEHTLEGELWCPVLADWPDRFSDWWHAFGSSDAVCRTLPGREGHIIVFAGDMTGGESPDGEGYEFLEMADVLGLHHLGLY